LPRRVLAATCGEHLAQNDFVNLVWRYAGFFKQGLDHGTAELVGTKAGQAASEATNGSAPGGGNYNITHG
jgi:hypothetical protein